MTHDDRKNQLTPKQREFVTQYLVDMNATAAAIRAGYSAKSAKHIASELMQKPHVAAAIAAEMEKREQRTHVSVDRVVAELAKIAFSNVCDCFDQNGQLKPIGKIPRDTQLAIESYERSDRGSRVKMVDKLGALEKLARHLGLFDDRLRLQGDQENPIAILVRELQGTTLRVAHNQSTDD